MPIDANIAMGYKPPQFESPVNALGNILQLQSAQQTNQLNGMKMQELQRGQAGDNALAQLLAGGKSGADVATGLAAQGFGQKSLDYTKLQTEQAKAQAAMTKDQLENAKKRVSMAGSAFGYVRQNPTVEAAFQALDQLGQNGVYTPEQVTEYKQKVTADPSKISSMADVAFRAAIDAEKQLAKYETRNTGGATETLGIDPVTGKVTVVNSVRNTQSPDSVASNARMAADAAAARGVTIRGQNMTDARSRDATGASMSKPFEVTGPDGKLVLVQQDKQGNIRPVQGYLGESAAATKPLNEGQAKAVAFASRMENSNAIINRLAGEGTKVSTPGSMAGYGVGTVVNALQPQSKQQLDQAKRDFVNAILRRESGAVIADSEFENANKQYFPQVLEGPKVIAQKARNRQIAIDGLKADIPKSMGDVTGDIARKAGGKPAAAESGLSASEQAELAELRKRLGK